MYYLGIIPARGGSKGIPLKNIAPLAGAPLIAYAIEAANSSTLLRRTIVSTDDEQIKKVALENGGDVPFLRPIGFSKDNSSASEVIIHALQELQLDIDSTAVVYLQPTSPFRQSKDIDDAISLFESSSADTVVSVVEVPHNFSAESQMVIKDGSLNTLLQKKTLLSRQEKEVRYARNGPAVLVCRARNIIDGIPFYDSRLKVMPVIMPLERSIDIDTPFDLKIAECFMIINNSGN